MANFFSLLNPECEMWDPRTWIRTYINNEGSSEGLGPKMQVKRLQLEEWEEFVGKVESLSVKDDRVQIVLSVTLTLLEMPISEINFALPHEGMNVGILRSKYGYHLRDADKKIEKVMRQDNPIESQDIFLGQG